MQLKPNGHDFPCSKLRQKFVLYLSATKACNPSGSLGILGGAAAFLGGGAALGACFADAFGTDVLPGFGRGGAMTDEPNDFKGLRLIG